MAQHTLIFLHGFLGDKNDWQPVIDILQNHPNYRAIALDLPFHGKNQTESIRNFDEASHWLSHQIKHQISQPYTLIGYSLGGRIAAYFACQQQIPTTNLQRVVLEGANLGLRELQQRESRWQSDLAWAKRFQTEPLLDVLIDWYQQPVFASLTLSQRENVIKYRLKNDGKKLSEMLQATSLAKQPDLREQVRLNREKFYYICGEKDQKFRTMADSLALSPVLISQAGHNAHRENPTEFTTKLLEILVQA
ncbi:2-succinyl-6-hydroxy-2,4-cyclohexadiene-1-carboxylate synthase [Mergibacter septicus]|uniref:Putative 2-succinyl-6-hydroxy-2,4-cyclohexadiene-1-carboxylate synthase n=1 Tax=Mergibacter septicus TaxID=221402 RepID=A0A8E3MIG4_9PAST|nr:2-succinyl-6-hydroxy-2,4-cyclohexadiene-1-carboxylate synthase [Mergibacter septicus]AWX16242.1 2-succinyl-6-hydroxy-2,4-cyclohexadiene-1-carboxylate synthase [Mergibacter septicus]QDJ15494.1 2-succinyl-6-hydroxy-2,4-cyclohexadiene-1-carboxylate synthase [Mergibacter septicus]UTU48636.1 2-succinyl-6-hydroxy-2,4-cyclohexadiene-1-carboxylate synthase [Mergibacter septicus]WMR95734.1 2-succinyl-6-hydroxy-2,4-cyclohexadiene-1-carboxylate synthase [Mergibacter septicus]